MPETASGQDLSPDSGHPAAVLRDHDPHSRSFGALAGADAAAAAPTPGIRGGESTYDKSYPRAARIESAGELCRHHKFVKSFSTFGKDFLGVVVAQLTHKAHTGFRACEG